jgi:hypothetical protein
MIYQLWNEEIEPDKKLKRFTSIQIDHNTPIYEPIRFYDQFIKFHSTNYAV